MFLTIAESAADLQGYVEGERGRGGSRSGDTRGGGWLCSTAQLGQYFKRPDIRKELTRYARVLSFRKTTLSSAGQAGVAAHPLAEPRGGGGRAPKEPRRRPSCCLCNHPRPSHSHPSQGATLHRVPLAHLIANNRLTSKSGLILKDNWKGIVPTAFMRKNKGEVEAVDGQKRRANHW